MSQNREKRMIVRARVVITMDGPPIENGAVVISGDKILDVGKFPEISKRHSREEIVDLDEQALLPGLINAHCHLDYTCLRGKIEKQKSFTDWIRAINAAKAKLSPNDYVASINDGFAEAQRFGTTTIANLTAFPELIAQIREPIRTWWFAELIDVRDPNRAKEIVDLAVGLLKSKQNWGLAPHAPFTVSANLYRRCEEIAERENVLLTTHLAESREEMQMFRDATGSLYDFLKELGRDMRDCGDKTPLEEVVGRLGSEPDWHHCAIPSWILVHLNEVAAENFGLLASSTGKSSIVHCPRSHGYFGHSPFQFAKLKNAGFNICLGTDSLASNGDLSLFAEMRAFQKEFPHVSSEEILKMVTINAARALRQENSLGKIRSDFAADLITVPCPTSTSVIDEVVAFDQPVDWSMIGGAIQVPA
jgi:cytosine/adenosine deaminase-related metal-dependent hydrolase